MAGARVESGDGATVGRLPQFELAQPLHDVPEKPLMQEQEPSPGLQSNVKHAFAVPGAQTTISRPSIESE